MTHKRWALPIDLENQNPISARQSTGEPDSCYNSFTDKVSRIYARFSISRKKEHGLQIVQRDQHHVVPQPRSDALPAQTNNKSLLAINPSTSKTTRDRKRWLWAKDAILDAWNKQTVDKTVPTMLLHNWAIFWLPSVPAGFAVKYTDQIPSVVFAVNFDAAIPISSYLSKAVDVIIAHVGQTVGSLLYVTFRYTPRPALLDILR